MCDKEKKSSRFATETYEAFSPEKASKVKAFVKEWLKKLIDRSRKMSGSSSSSASRQSRVGSSSSHTSSRTSVSAADEMEIQKSREVSGLATPLSNNDGDSQEDNDLIAAMVAEVGDDDVAPDGMIEEEMLGDDDLFAATPV